MRYAVPLTNGVLSAHFGHCEEFALVDVDPETQTIGEMIKAVPPAHEPGVLPAWLRRNGAEVIIASGMGSRAQALFSENGMRVVLGAPSAPPEELVAAHVAGTLEEGVNVCDH